jgi:hypothetical protein
MQFFEEFLVVDPYTLNDAEYDDSQFRASDLSDADVEAAARAYHEDLQSLWRELRQVDKRTLSERAAEVPGGSRPGSLIPCGHDGRARHRPLPAQRPLLRGVAASAHPAFWPTRTSPPPRYEADWHVHVHGIALFSWAILLIVQPALIASAATACTGAGQGVVLPRAGDRPVHGAARALLGCTRASLRSTSSTSSACRPRS